MKNIVFCLFCLICFVFHGQKYACIGEKGGEKYYIHEVEENNSLYGISKTYGVSVEEIQRTNPKTFEGLQLGHVLWIPVRYYDHVHPVQKGETLYGISRQYSVSVESLVAENEFLKDGLKEGQELVIKNLILPVKLESQIENPFSSNPKNSERPPAAFDSIMEYVVHPGETLYSISRRFMVPMDTLLSRNGLLSNTLSLGQKIFIPLKKELQVKPRDPEPDHVEVTTDSAGFNSMEMNSVRRIAVFLPFMLDTLDHKKLRPRAMEYYMGALLAIDSLKKHGVNCEFHFIDYESIKEPYDSVLASESFSQMDLVFAPFNLSKARKLKEWGENRATKIVFPIHSHNVLYDGAENNYFMEARPSVLDYNLALHLNKLENVQLVLIKTDDSLDRIRQDRFVDIFYAIEGSRKLIESNMSSYGSFSNKRTAFILLSQNESRIEEVLKFANEKEKLSVYGLNSWNKCHFVKSIENTTPFNYADKIYLSYSDSTLKSIHRSYRWKYNSDITRMSCKGYDATLNVVLHTLYNIDLPNGLIHRFNYDFNGEATRQNMGAYILNFNNLDITKLE